MRVLLDESLPRRLSARLGGHDVATVQAAGWSSASNGELLELAAKDGFDVVVTADQGIEFQQNLRNFQIGVVVVRAPSNRMEHLEPLVPEIVVAIDAVSKGSLVRVGR